MKVLYIVFLYLLLSCQQVFAVMIRENGCLYDCHEEIRTQEQHFTTYKEIKHLDFVKEMQYFERTSTPVIGANEVLHDCKDYKDWDNIVEDTNRGKATGYKVVDNKLFTTAGKRYLRCNDPANEKWIKKWTEAVEVVKTIEWSEFIPVDNIDYLTISRWVCVPIPNYFHGGGGGHRPHGGGGNGTAPVPEPATMLLFGAGLVGLASMKKFSK